MDELLLLAEKELKRLRKEVQSLQERLALVEAQNATLAQQVEELEVSLDEEKKTVLVDDGEDLARSIFEFAECQRPGYFHPNWSPATRRLILQALWEDVSGSVRSYGLGEPASIVGVG